MKRDIITTADGSTTLLDPVSGDHYHSTHGAEQESQHVYIEMGLKRALKSNKDLRILEVGMGTGLNIQLTWNHIKGLKKVSIDLVTLEPFPLDPEDISGLKFKVTEKKSDKHVFNAIHECKWDKPTSLSTGFNFEKKELKLMDYKNEKGFDLVYYDAFGPKYQPEMWTEACLKKVYSMMGQKASLVTYCAQGEFRRVLESIGFTVERLPGPPGKREMIRAIRS